MKRILIISGRHLIENPYREIPLKELFEEKGFEAKLFLPSRAVNAFGYREELKSDRVFKNAGSIWLEKVRDFKQYVQGCDAVLLGSWKTYKSLAQISRLYGKLVVGHDTTSGLDHYHNSAQYACLKSRFSKECMLRDHRELNNVKVPDPNSLIVTGSIAHDNYSAQGAERLAGRSVFLNKYGLDPSKNTVVFFPKGIKVLRDKIPLWFNDWSETRQQAYSDWFTEKYKEICIAVKQARCNLFIKMHPSAYASYRTSSSYEYDFWKRFSWAKVLRPEDTYACYRHLDFGIGINTHSALDMGYFGKPFIYVDSDQIQLPEGMRKMNNLTQLPLGPSSQWHRGGMDDLNPWFPSWLGHFSRAQDLPDLLNDPDAKRVSPEHREAFVKEYWYRSDGKASERIVSVVEKKLDEWNTIKQVKGKIYGLYQQSILTINRALKK